MNTKIFEIVMLVCFGIGWPVSIAKALRTRVVAGKSPAFMVIILLGYLSGILHKVYVSPDRVVWLYVLNLVMVAVDLGLYMKYRKNAVVS